MAWPPHGRPRGAQAPRDGLISCAAWSYCGACGHRMKGEVVRKVTHYQCNVRTMAPGAAALASHPSTVSLREDVSVSAINGWMGCSTRTPPGRTPLVPQRRTAVADAEQRQRRVHVAIEAGVDPVALVEPINRTQEELVLAQFERSTCQPCRRWDRPRRRCSTTSVTWAGAAASRSRQAGGAVRGDAAGGGLPPAGAGRRREHQTQ